MASFFLALHPLVFFHLVLGLIEIRCASAADDPAFAFTISTRKADDAVSVRGDADRMVFDIKSPSGIGRAAIARREGWPKSMILRLHLGGLEKFQVSNPSHSTSAAVSIREGKAEVRRWKDDKEEQGLDAKDAFWAGIRFFDRDGKPIETGPAKEGYIEVTLPPALFEGNPREIAVEWIDFYRN